MKFGGKIIAVWKPKGPTSHDVVQKIRRITGIKKVGHAGTLDPLAEGVLVVGIGRQATKKLGAIVQKIKEYEALIKLGENSETDDAEGRKEKIIITQKPSQSEILQILKKFKGRISQIPPKYSAIKLRGQVAYKKARKGESFELKSRTVEIKSIKLESYKWPYLKIKVITGPGVYIRALARDIGRELKTGAYLYRLSRTRVGNFKKEKAVRLSKLPQVLKKVKINS